MQKTNNPLVGYYVQTPNQDHITVALAQIVPVWLNRFATTAKIVDYIQQAAKQNARHSKAKGQTITLKHPLFLSIAR